MSMDAGWLAGWLAARWLGCGTTTTKKPRFFLVCRILSLFFSSALVLFLRNPSFCRALWFRSSCVFFCLPHLLPAYDLSDGLDDSKYDSVIIGSRFRANPIEAKYAGGFYGVSLVS